MQRAKKYIPTYTLFMAGVFHSPKPSKKKKKEKEKKRKKNDCDNTNYVLTEEKK